MYLALSALIRPRGLARSCMGAGVRPNWGTQPSGRARPGSCASTPPCQPRAGVCGRLRGWALAGAQQLACTDSQRSMLARVAQFSTTAPPPAPWRLAAQVDHLGLLVLHGVEHARHILEMLGQLVLDLARLARAPRRGPWRDVSGHLYRMGATALPITALVGFLIGVVLAYLMSLQLRQFGAE